MAGATHLVGPSCSCRGREGMPANAGAIGWNARGRPYSGPGILRVEWPGVSATVADLLGESARVAGTPGGRLLMVAGSMFGGDR